ncbi:MAG TPA: prohibitin family protein [Pirellulales bacterium]|nr:prohibitin family protein [Pirellulales bacterium]
MKSLGLLIAAAVAFIVLFVAMGSWGTIEAGHRGVVLRMGAVTGEIKGEGLYGKTPFLERVVPMDVRMQKEQVETEGASKDLQSVKTVVALNLSVLPDKCALLYQTIGPDYLETMVGPAMQESIKAVIAQYTAEELVSKREDVREAIAKLIAEKLNPIGLKIEALNIVNFDFSASFNQAIEAKVTAEQNALAAKNLLSQKEFEAQQAVAVAKGKADAMQIEANALRDNPMILQLRALEKWDGTLPKVTSGAVPFIDVGKFTDKGAK